MADDQESSYGPYKDEALQYSDLIGNLINPSAAGPAGPTRAPAATVAPKSAPAPEQHWESVVTPPAATPAATSTNGAVASAKPSNWTDLVRSGQTKLQTDQGELSRLQTTGAGVNQIKNPFLRGLGKVADVVGSTFTPGLARNIPGTTSHNLQLQGQASGRVAQDESALSGATQGADREAQGQERAARATKENAQATAYTPRTLSAEDAAAVKHPELTGESMDQRAFSAMLTTAQRGVDALDRTNANNTTKKDIAGEGNQTKKDIATQTNTTRKDIADNRDTTAMDVAKFRAAHRATAGRGPNDALRQPMIDAATDQIGKLNKWTYSPDEYEGSGGFYDPSDPRKVYTVEQFAQLKNAISSKLDKDLATKRLTPLGVRFTPEDAAKGGKAAAAGQTAPAKPAQAAATPTQTAPAPPAGATHQYRDAKGNIVGYAVNGKYVPVGAK